LRQIIFNPILIRCEAWLISLQLGRTVVNTVMNIPCP
jgi:hypothetical protein